MEPMQPGTVQPAGSRAGTEGPWALTAGRVAHDLGTDPVAGLAPEKAASRLTEVGENVLAEQERRPAWRLFAEQFASTVVVVLLVAAVVAAALGDLKDTLVILAILVLNGLLGFVQEYRAEQAMAALKAMTAPVVRVRRGGQVRELPAAEVVPGDLVLLSPGDLLAADLRLTESWALRVNEAALTGESEPVTKQVEPLPEIDESMLAERRNMAFRGTVVTGGRGAGVVVATGMATELGRLAELLQRQPPGPTPLQRRLAALGRVMAAAALVVCAVVFAVGVARGEPVERMFLSAVSLAVAAIPEGLPAVVTVALALGARRMAAPPRPGPQAACGGDARLDDGDLLGQDRHPDPEPHAGRAGLDPGGDLSGQRRWVRAGWCRHTRGRGRTGRRRAAGAADQGGGGLQRRDAAAGRRPRRLLDRDR
jgi:P-type Ca2+ transporter type 2C